MEIRRLRTEEYRDADRVFNISFGFKQEKEQPIGEGDARYGAFIDGVLTSVIYVPSYMSGFDGHSVKMAGIGGVSTLPQYRRKGGIRHIFEKLLPDLYEEGYVFSWLYPFSTAYYGKFGYAPACDNVLYTLNTASLPASDLQDKCRLYDGSGREEAERVIRASYEAFAQRFNGMTAYTGRFSKEILDEDPLRDAVYTYIFDEAEGKAFMTYTLGNGPEGLTVSVKRLMYTSMDACLALLSVVRSFASDYTRTVLILPAGELLEKYIKEWSFGYVRRELVPHGMARAVNVQKVLELASYRGSGSITLGIKDDLIPGNNAVFEIVYSEGTAKKVGKTDAAADITMNIADFSAAILGYGCDPYDISSAKYDKMDLSGIFYPKRIYITEEF